MGNSSPHTGPRGHYAQNPFEVLPRELHEVIGGYVLGTQPVRIDQILG
jgi:hypothetical protein